jgi:alpha-tubulin suppressor-like RCC1 family protein
VTTGDLAYCWGENFYGQLGVGTSDFEPHPRPLRVRGGLAFVRVNAGQLTTCGLTAANTANCWGDNLFGQLGLGTSTGPQQCGGIPTACSKAHGPSAGA